MKNRYLIIPTILIFVWVFMACATPPIDDMNRAQDAVLRAENDANAVNYASPTLLQARDALSRMQAEADARRYDAARNLAAEAISHAERAIADGRAGAARAREEAENVIRNLDDLMAQTSTAVSNARRVPNTQIDFNAISREMDLAQRALDETKQSFQAGNYRDVISRGQIIRSMLSDINSRLIEAIQATSRKQ